MVFPRVIQIYTKFGNFTKLHKAFPTFCTHFYNSVNFKILFLAEVKDFVLPAEFHLWPIPCKFSINFYRKESRQKSGMT